MSAYAFATGEAPICEVRDGNALGRRGGSGHTTVKRSGCEGESEKDDRASVRAR